VSDVVQPDPWNPDLDERVSRLKGFKLGNVPPPVIARAEQLCDLVDDVDGIRPDRQALIAALVFAATPDGKKLAEAWQKYRVAPVRDIVLGEHPESGSVDLSPYTRSAKASEEA
jgi:hypothetical protein